MKNHFSNLMKRLSHTQCSVLLGCSTKSLWVWIYLGRINVQAALIYGLLLSISKFKDNSDNKDTKHKIMGETLYSIAP